MIVSTWEVVFHPIVVKNVLSIKMERIRNWSKQVLRAYPLSISGEGHHLVKASKTKQVRKICSSCLFYVNHYKNKMIKVETIVETYQDSSKLVKTRRYMSGFFGFILVKAQNNPIWQYCDILSRYKGIRSSYHGPATFAASYQDGKIWRLLTGSM